MAITTEEKRTYEPQIRAPAPPTPEVRREIPLEPALRNVINRVTVEGFFAGGAVVLAILSLAAVAQQTLLSISTIAVGAALLLEGITMAWQFSGLLSEPLKDFGKRIRFFGGVSTQILAGCAGILFGILALLDVAPMTLLPVAAIVFGSGLILASGVIPRLDDLHYERPAEHDSYWYAVREVASWIPRLFMLVGPGTIVLGILALAGVNPMTLTLVAMLGIGCAVTLGATAICARCFSYLYH